MCSQTARSPPLAASCPAPPHMVLSYCAPRTLLGVGVQIPVRSHVPLQVPRYQVYPCSPWQHGQALSVLLPVWVISVGSARGLGEYVCKLHESRPASGHPSSGSCVGSHSHTTSIFPPANLRRRRQQGITTELTWP